VERSARRPVDATRDRILVDGRPVGEGVARLVLALHKPPGLVTARVDPGGRPTVYEALGDIDRWVFPVGRLDRATSGLLIFTNDTWLARRLTDPQRHVDRTYHALVQGQPDAETLRGLREGVDLGGGERTRPAVVRRLGSPRAATDRAGPPPRTRRTGDGRTWLEIVLTEGRNRQVRRMLAGLGHDVLALVRVRIGALGLGALAPGEWRRLGPAEEEALFGHPPPSAGA
jgi:23S rRNA pseudouridine2605 synthase